MWEKNKGTTECEKITITCDIGIAQYENGTIKCEKKKSKKTTKCEKSTVTCDIGIAKMWRWNCQVWEKSKETIKCEKRTVTCDVETAKCEDGIVKSEKKVREPPNVTKELSHVMLELYNMRMKPSNVKKM